MDTKGIFPKKDNEFNTYFLQVVLYLFGTNTPSSVQPSGLPLNTLRLGMTEDGLHDFWMLFYNWSVVFPKTQNRDLRTPALNEQKDVLKEDSEAEMRKLYRDIPESKLLPDDRATLNLRAPDTHRTPVPAAAHSPKMDVDKNEYLLQTLRITNPETPHTQAMPKGQKVVIEMYIGEAGLAPANIPFSVGFLATRFLHRINFSIADVSKTVYYRCCYENTRGEKGPWGEMISEVIW
jgi:hypothetical protein